MKKLFIITITLCMVFVLTACSTKDKNNSGNGLLPTNNTEKKEEEPKKVEPTRNVKQLECVKDYSSQMSNNISMEQEVYMKFVDNKVEKMIMSMNFELPSNLASTADTFVNTMKNTYDSKYGIYDGVKVTLKRDSNTEFSILIDMDFPKLSATDRTALGMSGSEDYTVNRNAFIREGYTCE